MKQKQESDTSTEYFIIARQWYTTKYISVYNSCSYLALITVLSLISAIVLGLMLGSTTNKRPYLFPVYKDDMDYAYVSSISKINNGHPNQINFAIAEYFLRHYINLREHYDPDLLSVYKWEELLLHIQQSSSAQVFEEFVNYYNTQKNPESPILRYRNAFVRNINITSVQFIGSTERPGKAIVQFTAVEKSTFFSQEQTISEWIAEILFDMPSMHNVYNKKIPLYFNVIQYRVVQKST